MPSPFLSRFPMAHPRLPGHPMASPRLPGHRGNDCDPCCQGNGGGGTIAADCCQGMLPETLHLTVAATCPDLDGQTITLQYNGDYWEGDLFLGSCAAGGPGGDNGRTVFELHCRAGSTSSADWTLQEDSPNANSNCFTINGGVDMAPVAHHCDPLELTFEREWEFGGCSCCGGGVVSLVFTVTE